MKQCKRCGSVYDNSGFEHNRKVCRACMRQQRNEIRWANERRARWAAARQRIKDKYGVGQHGARLGKGVKVLS